MVVSSLFVPAFQSAQPNGAIVAALARERAYRPDLYFGLCEDPTRAGRDVQFELRLSVVEDCAALWPSAASPHPFVLLVQEAEWHSLRRITQLREVEALRYLPPTALSVVGLLKPASPRPLYLVANFETDEPLAMDRWRKERKRALREQADVEPR